jgi:hypothetical protein
MDRTETGPRKLTVMTRRLWCLMLPCEMRPTPSKICSIQLLAKPFLPCNTKSRLQSQLPIQPQRCRCVETLRSYFDVTLFHVLRARCKTSCGLFSQTSDKDVVLDVPPRTFNRANTCVSGASWKVFQRRYPGKTF